ncbi:hypothetical protein Tco_1449652 [Tanacetum coccineum]
MEQCFKKDTLWVKWVSMVKLKGRNIWDNPVDKKDSWGWKNLMVIRDKFRPHVMYQLGNGEIASTYRWVLFVGWEIEVVGSQMYRMMPYMDTNFDISMRVDVEDITVVFMMEM